MMKRERGVVLALAMALAGGTFGSVSECELPRGSRALWDVKALDKAPRTFPVEIPCSNEYGRVAGVEPIFIEGEPLKGKATRVFAWWGLPKGASAEKKVPAMVLVHGGGGTAFAKWVKLWNDRGYAAIAMDTCGAIPQGERDGKAHPRHAWSGPSGWGSSVAQIGEPLKDQWTYHAVAAVMRCHSYLRSLPEVDRDRIGLTGISWGGYLSSIVGSVDDRFRFAAPVYGCGYYERNPEWHKMDRDKEKLRAWFALWDPTPQRCNIEFAEVKADGTIRMRVWERGSGITLACGTGACATAVAANLTGRRPRQSDIEMDGGTLNIEWNETDNHIYMTGPAAISFEGEIDLPQD